MADLQALLVLAIAGASIYAVAASGLVVTYTTSGIFNFAHGAIAMVSAFVYWQLSSPDAWDLPVPLALVLTVLVFAPGFGLLLERFIMRRLHDASPITRLVVPIGLLVALIQAALIIWPPRTVNPALPDFFADHQVTIAGAAVTYHQIITFLTAVAVAIGLRILLYNTRIGVAMRAVVDNRELAALNGIDTDRVSAVAWAIGCSLAAVAGILVAPTLKLDQIQLTFLVINAYAAAMVGRLRSLPLTAVGALILGLASEASRTYSEHIPSWINSDTMPALVLFLVLLAVPQDKAAVFSVRPDRSAVPRTTVRAALVAGVALVAVLAVVPSVVEPATLRFTGYAVALGIIALSLIPLTGYAGQISLAPLAFAGIGALAMHRFGADGNPLGLVAAAVISGGIGALVALPVLRMKGLYLALATMAFAVFCERAIFLTTGVFKDKERFDRIDLFGLSTDSNRANLVLMGAVFALLGVGITAMRRGPFGRRLQALKDSPAACATLGVNPTLLKLQVFALSSAIAGVGGALLAGWRHQVDVNQFSLLGTEPSALPLVLLTVIAGIAAVAGALLAGLLISLVPLLAEGTPALQDALNLLPGLAGIALAANPDGAIAQTSAQVRARWAARGEERRRPTGRVGEALSLLAPSPVVDVPERVAVGVSAAASADLMASADEETGLTWGRCHADPRSA